jgi:hypothetical protein
MPNTSFLWLRVHVLGLDDEHPELQRPWPPQNMWTDLGLLEHPASVKNKMLQKQQQKQQSAPAAAQESAGKSDSTKPATPS